MPNAISRRHLLRRHGRRARGAGHPAARARGGRSGAAHQPPLSGLEYYADKLKSALPGVAVDTRLMQAPEAIQLQRLALSSGSAQLDILWANSITHGVVRQEWLAGTAGRSLGEAQGRVQPGRLQPGFGRRLFATTAASTACRSPPTRCCTPIAPTCIDEKGLKPAKTWDDYIANAKALNSPPRRYGVILALKSDMVNNEMHVGDEHHRRRLVRRGLASHLQRRPRRQGGGDHTSGSRSTACPASPPCTTTSTRST